MINKSKKIKKGDLLVAKKDLNGNYWSQEDGTFNICIQKGEVFMAVSDIEPISNWNIAEISILLDRKIVDLVLDYEYQKDVKKI
jgi:hypothetical protein